jgi:hypothetical protein
LFRNLEPKGNKMKELEQYEKVSQEIVTPIKKETELLGTLRPQKGHKCFELNVKTNEIREAEFAEEEIRLFTSSKDGHSVKRKINVKDDCIYFTALNKQNALKKFNKVFNKD